MKPVMTYDYQLVKYLALQNWCSITWECLSSNQATINTESLRLQPQHKNDKTLLMEVATLHYKGKPLQRINLYLQVFFLPDMTDSAGTHVNQYYFEPSDNPPCKTTLQWPQQQLPGPRSWKIWRPFLYKHFTCSYMNSHTRRLSRSLCNWLTTLIHTQNWYSFIDPPTRTIFHRTTEDTPWNIYKPDGCSRSRYKHLTTNLNLPDKLVPISLKYISQDTLHALPFSHQQSLDLTDSNLPNTFSQYLAKLPEHERIVLGRVMCLTTNQLEEVAQMILESNFCIGSDGSGSFPRFLFQSATTYL
mmetsp:Transcript_4931/g.7601  ORF Transcript_4931/g.7601 Transcript_4931/m.7601 type:complete len:302 (-) Transcript_4931:427-1332(-)